MKVLVLLTGLLGAVLTGCSGKPNAPDEPPVPRIAWTNPVFLDSGRIGFIQVEWEDYQDYCADYFDWELCTEQRKFHAWFLALSPADSSIDTLFAIFPKKPPDEPDTYTVFYLPPRIVYMRDRRLGAFNLSTGEHREIGITFFPDPCLSRSGLYATTGYAYGEGDRVDLLTGKVSQLLPSSFTVSAAKGLFEINYYDDLTNKAILTGTTYNPWTTTHEILYDLTAKTLDSSRSAHIGEEILVFPKTVVRMDVPTSAGLRLFYASKENFAAGDTLKDTVTLLGYPPASFDPVYGSERLGLEDIDVSGKRFLFASSALHGSQNGFSMANFNGTRRDFRTKDFYPAYFPDSTAAP